MCNPDVNSKYVLKIMNGVDSEEWNHGFIDAMNKMMIHLTKKGILTNIPVNSIAGLIYCYFKTQT